ncbi:phage terminase small subunit P27 family [Clostridium nigeriense]|uniref:phage terminase small subunit P27 family n=1 Tax=Clostridium nigeriense TaxID=1805470 RepID=UPI003D32B9D2
MAKKSKPVSVATLGLSNEKIEARQEAEDKLKGSDNLVYQAPSDLVQAEKEVYLFLVNELRGTGILNNLDIEMLKMASNAVVNIREARKNIRKYGQLITRANGDLVKNPAITILKDFEAILARCTRELALSPSSRASLARLTAETQSNQEDELLKILSE